MPRWFFPVLVTIFLAGHAVCRCLTYAHLEYDEAEQLTLVQTLSIGYYYQPPLFTWLLWPLVQLIGPNVYALLFLRTFLFVLLFILSYRVSLRVCADPTLASLAALSLLLIPEIFHGAIGMWTHTSLLLVLTMATLLLVLRLREQAMLRDYLLLGLCGGLGVLAKYNYVHFAAALAVALAVSPAWRVILLDRRMILSVALAGIIAAPHLIWMLGHAEEVRYGFMRYTEVRQNQLEGWQGTLKHLSVNLFQNIGRSFGFVLLPVLLLLAPVWRQAAGEQEREPRLLLARLILAAAVLLAIVMLLGGVRHLRQHWLTPFAVLLAPLILARFDLARLAPWRVRSYQAVLALVVLGALGWRGGLIVRYAEAGCLTARDHVYAEQANQLRAAGWDEHFAVAEQPYTAGFLRLHFPQARVRCTFFPSHEIPDAQTDAVLITWVGGVTEADRFRKFATNFTGLLPADDVPAEGVITLHESKRYPEAGPTVLRYLVLRRQVRDVRLDR